MGCDGGTIPKRNEIVKNKQKNQGRDKNADLSAKWQFCSLSGLPLKKPIVACQLGRLYNKDAIIEHLLTLKTATPSSSTSIAPPSQISHIRSLKDVKELKLKEKADFNQTHQASSGSEKFKAQFVCPISGLDINGKYRFYYLTTCGCVLSERALKEVPDDKQCILCSKPYESSMDLIVLNGDEEETRDLREKLSLRRRQQRSQNRDKLALENPNIDNNGRASSQCKASSSTNRAEMPAVSCKLLVSKDEPKMKKHKPEASSSTVR